MARWYIIHAYSGFENKVRDSIIAEAQRMGLSEAVEAVEVPTETVTEVKRGKKVQVGTQVHARLRARQAAADRRRLPPDQEHAQGHRLPWLGRKPQPISEREAARYFGGMEEAKAAPKREIHVDYEIGDQVKVNAGPFASFNGVVEELDYEKQRVKVSVSIFGRATPVELGFEEVELVK